MKKLFRIAVIVCPLINFSLIIFLSAGESSDSILKENSKDEAAAPIFQTSPFISAEAVEEKNSFNGLSNYAAPRLYFIEYRDCFGE